MKAFQPLLLIILWSLNSTLVAQVIGDDALQRVQDGNVSFLEGEFIVFLDDTVSSGFIEKRFEELGYEVSYLDIQPLQISIVNRPADSILTRLENHPEVSRSFIESVPIDSTYFKELLEEQGLTGEAFDQAYDRLLTSQSNEERFFEFRHSVNVGRLKEIMGNFRSVAYQIFRDFPRSVNVACEPGKEKELMEKIEELPYVESTALIGIIE
ncbi:MAG: hypothetical protein JJ971_03935 [Balneolaceae bacterium]|nr:hypothetical protein [Balneolaceae bacterium]MBO6545523.1 hypothetical protein [Balneolaceae bacterium]MBO6646919.1 hypothetical protein [Balneolaceae bacterium]